MKICSKILSFLISYVWSSTCLPYVWSSSQGSLKTKNYLTLVHSLYQCNNIFFIAKISPKIEIKTLKLDLKKK